MKASDWEHIKWRYRQGTGARPNPADDWPVSSATGEPLHIAERYAQGPRVRR